MILGPLEDAWGEGKIPGSDAAFYVILIIMLRDTAKILVILTALVWLARHPDVTVRVQRGVESASRYLTHALGLDSRDSRVNTLQEKVSRPPAAVKQTSPQSSFTPERTMRSSRY